MSYRKLNLDRDKIDLCRTTASRIINPLQKYIDRHSTTCIERSIIKLLFNSTDEASDIVIQKLGKDRLRKGAALWLGNALIHTRLRPDELVAKIAEGEITIDNIPKLPIDKIKTKLISIASAEIQRIKKEFENPHENSQQYNVKPLIIIQKEKISSREALKQAGKEPADIILFDNYDILKNNLSDIKVSCNKKFGYKIDGARAPQRTATSLKSGVDLIAIDLIKQTLSNHINIKKILIDSNWIGKIISKTNTKIYSDAVHVRNLDAYREAHQIVALQLMLERLFMNSNIIPEQFIVTHAYDIDPSLNDGFINELARASLMRELYPKNLTVYLSPAARKLNTPDHYSRIFTLFQLSGIITEQSAILIPQKEDNADILKSIQQISDNTTSLGDEIQFNPNGKITRRAHIIVENTLKLLKKIEQSGFYKALSDGLIAGIKTNEKHGSGLNDIFQKDRDYFNPFADLADSKEDNYCVSSRDLSIRTKSKDPEQKKDQKTASSAPRSEGQGTLRTKKRRRYKKYSAQKKNIQDKEQI